MDIKFLKNAWKNLIVFIAFLPTILAFNLLASEDMDYLLHYSSPAYQNLYESFKLVSNEPANNSDALLAQYKLILKNMKELDTLREGVISHFSPTYIQNGDLAETVFYIDYQHILSESYNVGGKQVLEYLKKNKSFIQNYKTLPDLMQAMIEIEKTELEKLDSKIKSATESKVASENARKDKFAKYDNQLGQLETKVDKANDLKASNDAKESQRAKTAKTAKTESVTTIKAPVNNLSKTTDDMATYAAILGRATACGINTESAFQKVGYWLDRVFPPGSSEQQTYLPIFLSGVEFHMNKQLNGESPDTCDSIQSAFASFPWPK